MADSSIQISEGQIQKLQCRLQSSKHSVDLANWAVAFTSVAASVIGYVGAAQNSAPANYGAATVALLSGASMLYGNHHRRKIASSRLYTSSSAVLRYLAQEAFDIKPDDPELASVPNELPCYRFTAYWSTKWGGERVMFPMLRAPFRQPLKTPRTTVFFRPGEPFVGTAWQNIGEPTSASFRSLDDLGGNRGKWRSQWAEAGLTTTVLDRMGRVGGSGNRVYIQNVRTIACVGVKFTQPSDEVVFALDSLLADGFDERFLRREDSLKELADTIGIVAAAGAGSGETDVFLR